MSKEINLKEQVNQEPENKENVIEIKNLCKKYKMYHRKKDRLLEILLPHYEKHSDFTALENFNLTLKKGEILGILGRNGAGKSTLLKMITGVVTPTAGTIKIKGRISSLLELGTAFNPELTGYENIYQHGQVMGMTKEEQNQVVLYYLIVQNNFYIGFLIFKVKYPIINLSTVLYTAKYRRNKLFFLEELCKTSR